MTNISRGHSEFNRNCTKLQNGYQEAHSRLCNADVTCNDLIVAEGSKQSPLFEQQGSVRGRDIKEGAKSL